MKKHHRKLQFFIALVLVISLFGPAVYAAERRAGLERIQPQLAAMIADSPDQVLRVIVQKAGAATEPEQRVAELGGKVTKELRLINGFAAEMPAKAILKLARTASVNWVSLDAPMTFSTGPASNVRDEFTLPLYTNNDGSESWAGPWVEDDISGPGPITGNVNIVNGALRLDDQPDTGTTPSLARKVNLSAGVDSAVFSFDFLTGPGVDIYDDKVAIEVSTNGGASYNILEIISNLTGNVSGSRSYDLTPYLSANTMIRFRIYNLYGGADEFFQVDNVQIAVGADQNFFHDTLGIDQLHAAGLTGQGITVAVVDSGIGNHPDFAGRLLTTPEYGIGDLYGHGTHVAGIIGGSGLASGGLYTGVAPGVTLLNLGVSDQYGMSYESDVVEALQWAHDNKDLYNIRIVNLSINSTVEDSFNKSAINAALEILWFNNVVVVVSAGNTGAGGSYNTIKTAPANDPFVIVVGASKENDTSTRTDDAVTNFSSYGTSLDGFTRPDIIAPGFNVYAALSPDSSWDVAVPERLDFGGEYIRLSGTSMASPIVAGVAALLLQDEPGLTPDQVKYRLLNTGTTVANSAGTNYTYLDAYAAVTTLTTASANQGLKPHDLLAQMAMIAYWASANGEETIDWENIDWEAVNWDTVNWNSVDWDSINWDSVNWNSVNWNSVNWNSVNWNSVNWNSVNWNSVNWNSVNWNSLIYNPGENATAGGEVTRSDGIFWGEEDIEFTGADACKVKVKRKGEKPAPECIQPVWEKRTGGTYLTPIPTK